MEAVNLENKNDNNAAIEAVAQSFINEICQSDEFKEKIKIQLEKSLSSAVTEALRRGPVQKQIEKTVTKALAFNPEDLALPAYNELMMNHVMKSFAGILHEENQKKFDEDLANLLSTQPGETKLSELIDMFIEEMREPEDMQGEISLHIELSDYSSSLAFVYFDFEEDVRKYACGYKLVIDTKRNELQSFTADNTENEKLLTNYRYLSAFDAKLFNLYAAKAKLIIDEDYCSKSYEYY